MSNGEQKAAALTPEQIRNLPAIRKKYLKSKYPYYSDSAYSYLKQKGAFTQN